ncbi:WYL domain-containing protein [Glaciecola sp. KUL10]|uniref:WYL domain-containing protein n=1 Tax=Glaciecola sp. (strain KUL10) TaxID=2161813 RepID=UPI000D78978D|nr:WYL domain-containing protein [Glaciecola sp. KUL10]GBL05192.1 hypothetical protein KUL10_25120 [Glaciecola sp. KUL10]
MDTDKQNLYFKFIELLAYWQGGVNSTELVRQFDISAKYAKDKISEYKSKHNQNIKYDASLKKFVLSQSYSLNYLSKNANEYLDWLHHPNSLFINHQSPIRSHIVDAPQRDVSHLVIQGIVTAIQKKLRLDVDYVSLSNPNTEGRVIQPLCMVKTGVRWHLRAFDEKNQEFRDFVLSRFKGRPELMDKQTVSPSDDERWCTEQVLIFEPDSRLSDDKKRVIESDYSMQNGQLIIKTNQALVQYVLQEMQINPNTVHMSPEGQQLILKNYDEVKALLF